MYPMRVSSSFRCQEREGEGVRQRDGRKEKSILLPDRTLPCLFLTCTNNLTLTRHNAALGCIPYTYTYFSCICLHFLFVKHRQYHKTWNYLLQTTYRVPIASRTLYPFHTTILVLAAEQQLFVASLYPLITKTKTKKKKKKK